MRCNRTIVAAALCATLAACADQPAGPSALATGPDSGPALAMNATTSRVVAYFPSWDNRSLDVFPWNKVTHVVYAFAQPTASGGITGIPMSGDAKLSGVVSRAHAAGAKVLISFGGWTGSDDSDFEPMAASATARAAFVSNVVTFVNNYGLDGVDIDWEFPEAGAESANFTLLMDELNTALGSSKLLTAAVAATGSYAGAVASDVFADVDFLFLMAYARSNLPHSPMSYAVESLDYWSNRGLPQSKTVLGVPFYGRNSSGSRLPYRELVRLYSPAPADDVANGYSFNGIETMKQKTALSLQRGSGIGIWELSQDTTAASVSLLNAIHDAMNAPLPPHDYTRIAYDDTLKWANWSWSVTLDTLSTAQAYQGTKSIAVQSMQGWGGLQLYYGAGVNPSTVTTLEFWIHGGSTGGQTLRVYVADPDGSLTRVPLNSYVAGGSVAANAWRKVSIPLSALGVTTTPIVKFVVQEATGNAQNNPFYVDYIRFLP